MKKLVLLLGTLLLISSCENPKVKEIVIEVEPHEHEWMPDSVDYDEDGHIDVFGYTYCHCLYEYCGCDKKAKFHYADNKDDNSKAILLN